MPALQIAGTLLLALVAAGADAAHEAPTVHDPQEVAWGPCPVALPARCKLAVLAGEPTAEVPFTIRFWLPDGYRVAPHSHPTDENVTVVYGTLHAGMGDPPPKRRRYRRAASLWCERRCTTSSGFEGDTVLQIHGIGPFAITYVNLADDPRAAPPTKP